MKCNHAIHFKLKPNFLFNLLKKRTVTVCEAVHSTNTCYYKFTYIHS